MAWLIVCLHPNNFEITCQIENARINIKQSRKLVVCFLNAEPFDNEITAMEVQMIASIPSENVINPIASSMSSVNLKILNKPIRIAINPNKKPNPFFM